MYEIFDNIPLHLNENSILNEHYNLFGNVYDFVKTNHDDNEAEKFIEEWCSKEIGINILNLGDYPNYEEEITNSQLKTKMGILIINYLKKKHIMDDKLSDFYDIHSFIKKIEKIKNQFSNNQILRIFSYFMKRTIGERVKTNLFVLSNLTKDSHSPYYLATKFNLEEIDKMNEYSKIFQGYLQKDSFILYNYQKKAYSYSLSIEPLFIVKYHLRSTYEGFFFTENIINDKLAWKEKYLNVIVINDLNLLEKSKYDQILYIEDENDSKDHAFGISMILRHESNSKKEKYSPIYYCDNGETKEIRYKENNIFKGEDGLMIESLILDDLNLIISLVKDFIYGNLLEVKYFIGKDFSELEKKMIQIRKDNENYFKALNEGKKSNGQNNYDEIKRRSLKTGTFEYGDQFYRIEMIEKMISLAKHKGHLDQIPKIFIEIEKAIEESKKEKK